MKLMRFESSAAFGSHRTLIRRNPDSPQTIEMIEAVWGLHIGEEGSNPFQFLRSEARQYSSQRCLIPASEFHVRNGDRKFRVTLDDGDSFYLAAVWQPATRDRGTSFAVITIKANPDVFHYQERQGAVMLRRQNMAWLDLTEPQERLLQPLPPCSFRIEEIAPAAPMRGQRNRLSRNSLRPLSNPNHRS